MSETNKEVANMESEQNVQHQDMEKEIDQSGNNMLGKKSWDLEKLKSSPQKTAGANEKKTKKKTKRRVTKKKKKKINYRDELPEKRSWQSKSSIFASTTPRFSKFNSKKNKERKRSKSVNKRYASFNSFSTPGAGQYNVSDSFHKTTRRQSFTQGSSIFKSKTFRFKLRKSKKKKKSSKWENELPEEEKRKNKLKQQEEERLKKKKFIYDNMDIRTDFLSTFKSPKSSRVMKSKTQRFAKSETFTPGPGKYRSDLSKQFSEINKSVSSPFKSKTPRLPARSAKRMTMAAISVTKKEQDEEAKRPHYVGKLENWSTNLHDTLKGKFSREKRFVVKENQVPSPNTYSPEKNTKWIDPNKKGPGFGISKRFVAKKSESPSSTKYSTLELPESLYKPFSK